MNDTMTESTAFEIIKARWELACKEGATHHPAGKALAFGLGVVGLAISTPIALLGVRRIFPDATWSDRIGWLLAADRGEEGDAGDWQAQVQAQIEEAIGGLVATGHEIGWAQTIDDAPPELKEIMQNVARGYGYVTDQDLEDVFGKP